VAKGKGNLTLLALGMPKGRPKGDDSYSDDDESDEDMGDSAKSDAARDLIAAVKKGDVAGVSDALTAHYDACHAAQHEEEEAEEEEG
jgi:DNA-binding GntR family transcriptional regulator